MKPWFALVWFTLSMLGSGCALAQDATRNLVMSVKIPIEVHQEKARNRQWAEAAWLSACAAEKTSHSGDYAHGFKDGYAEYLFHGGDGEVPLTPPLHYRNTRYQTPEGYAAIQDWFNGYRHGTMVARDSGARQWITGPSALQSGLTNIIVPGPLPAQADPPRLPQSADPMPLPEPRVPPAPQDQVRASASAIMLAPVIDPTAEAAPESPFARQQLADTVKARITGIREAPLR